MSLLSRSEQAYIQSSLLASKPLRADGRNLLNYRSIAVETGVVSLANGSARVGIGNAMMNGLGGSLLGTEVLAAVKLEVQTSSEYLTFDNGNVSCSVSCSPTAYPLLSNNAIDDWQSDLTAILHDTLSHPTLQPSNLSIVPGKKSWLLHLDVVILSDHGNIFDALFIAAAAALKDTKIPRTRQIEYRARSSRQIAESTATEDLQMKDVVESNFDTRAISASTDFELVDYWDDGDPLKNTLGWPVCVTLNLLPPIHFLDANVAEENAIPSRLLLFFTFSGTDLEGQAIGKLQGMRLLGHGETDIVFLQSLIEKGETYARSMHDALDKKLKAEVIRRKPQLHFSGKKS